MKEPFYHMEEQPGQGAPLFTITEVAQVTHLTCHFPNGF